jgi:putative ubiquitin-RnfH superfamily antitoxin RatB of RatAB toxin-antitoxin module
VALTVPAGTSVADAIRLSALGARSREVDMEDTPVGIHGRIVTRDATLADGDRVEIYRPIKADPKQARRRRAAAGR